MFDGVVNYLWFDENVVTGETEVLNGSAGSYQDKAKYTEIPE